MSRENVQNYSVLRLLHNKARTSTSDAINILARSLIRMRKEVYWLKVVKTSRALRSRLQTVLKFFTLH